MPFATLKMPAPRKRMKAPPPPLRLSAGVQARDCGDRVREGRRVRQTDVDVSDRLERVLDAQSIEQPWRGGRELPANEDGDPGRREKAVAEAPVPVARAVIEPNEELRSAVPTK
jgi:hypothetical protein